MPSRIEQVMTIAVMQPIAIRISSGSHGGISLKNVIDVESSRVLVWAGKAESLLLGDVELNGVTNMSVLEPTISNALIVSFGCFTTGVTRCPIVPATLSIEVRNGKVQ